MKRPDGWANKRSEYFESHQEKNRWGKTRQLDYEAGADARWEALMKYRVKMPPDFTPILIVIPSEEVE